MNAAITCLLLPAALPALAQAPPVLAGHTYTAKMGEACAVTTGGGCLKTFYYQLRFSPDSVGVMWLLRADCSHYGRDTTYTTATRPLRYAYRFSNQTHRVLIPGFSLAPLLVSGLTLVGKQPALEGGAPVVFEPEK